MGAEWVGLLKAEQFTNLQQLRAKATVFFTVHTEVGLAWSDSSLGCEIELCVPELLGTLFFPLEWSGFHQLFHRWDGPKKNSHLSADRPSSTEALSEEVCLCPSVPCQSGNEKNEEKGESLPYLDEKKSLLCVYSVWTSTVASSACGKTDTADNSMWKTRHCEKIL